LKSNGEGKNIKASEQQHETAEFTLLDLQKASQRKRERGSCNAELVITALIFITLGAMTIMVMRQLDSLYSKQISPLEASSSSQLCPWLQTAEELTGTNSSFRSKPVDLSEYTLPGKRLKLDYGSVQKILLSKGISADQVVNISDDIPGGVQDLSAEVTSNPDKVCVRLNVGETRVIPLDSAMPGLGLSIHISSGGFVIPRCEYKQKGCIRVSNVRGISICGIGGINSSITGAAIKFDEYNKPQLEISMDTSLSGSPMVFRQIPLGNLLPKSELNRIKQEIAQL